MQYGTTDAATACSVTLNTIRAWARDYAAFLSPGASGSDGQRVFTARDLEVLKYIAQLRAERMQKGAILVRLGETTFGEVASDEIPSAVPVTEQPGTAIMPAPATQNEPDSTAAFVMVVNDLAHRFEALEQANAKSEQAKVNDRRLVRDAVFMFMAGVVVALLIVLIVLVAITAWMK